MTQDVETSLRGTIDRVYVINLKSRPDRRREMETELGRIGLAPQSPLVAFFDAVKPPAAGDFPSVGARGCFMSHLGIIERAAAAGHRAILILEDDATVAPEHRAGFIRAVEALAAADWALAYPGYRIAGDPPSGAAQAMSPDWCRVAPQTDIGTTHAMLIRQQAYAPLIAYLRDMMARPAGHRDGGPMHVDGAYSWFRRSHPDLQTWVTPQPLVAQRASASDITPASWKEKVPLVGLLRRIKNRLRG